MKGNVSSKGKPPKSTPEARRLIAAYIKKYGNERAAATALGMTHGALNKIKRGLLRDTPAMRAAIKRADARAKRAWLAVGEKDSRWIDSGATLRAIRRELEMAIETIDALIKQNSGAGQS